MLRKSFLLSFSCCNLLARIPNWFLLPPRIFVVERCDWINSWALQYQYKCIWNNSGKKSYAQKKRRAKEKAFFFSFCGFVAYTWDETDEGLGLSFNWLEWKRFYLGFILAFCHFPFYLVHWPQLCSKEYLQSA